MTSDELVDFAASVKTRGDFISFVHHLRSDYRKNKEEWQNDNIDDFLGGLHGFASDMGGYYKNVGESVDVETITWRIAAEMLVAASVYGS